ncbi:hypothetical protein [Gordonia phage GTE5]|uniref:Uncharacterized protein n=1 Tax=Gordonia phage GTE5 TaxID=319522 RepID=G8EJV1_9CAUD|nr:hypothetical protein GoPhGTE5p84 [Gordonia phage GTE5]AET09833.1 hypothetical protein [Gordonia phage GTE5]
MTDETLKIPEDAERRETTLNLITATLASAAVQSEKAFRESGWRRFAQWLLDNPKLIIFSDNWLTDEEVAAIYAASRDPKLRVGVRPWDTEPGLVKTAQDTERLQKWMEHNLPGNQAKRCPTTADTAIMAMDELIRERGVANSAVRGVDRLEKWIAENIPAGEQDWTRNAFDTAIRVMDELRKDRQQLAEWLNLEFGDVIDPEESPTNNAIYVMGELREKYRAASEAIESLRARQSIKDRAELEKLRGELNEQTRRLAAETKTPPQSVEDAKREAVRKLAEGIPVEEIYAGPRWSTVAAGKTPLGRNNRFKGVRSVSTLLNELAGAASMCWENVTAAGEFDSTKAKQAVEEALDQLDNIARHAVKSGDDEALAKAIWSDPALNWMPPESADAKAFIDGQQRLHVLSPDSAQEANDLLKMVVERIDTLTETVRQIVGGGTVKVRAEDTTFDNGPKTGNDEL